MHSTAAGVARRAVATLVDWLALTIATIPVALATTAVGLRPLLSWTIAFLLVASLYWPLGYRLFRGQTLGKQVLGLRAVSASATPLGLTDTVLREAVLKGLVLVWATGIVGLIATTVCALVRRDRRGLHDLVLGTSVIAPPRQRSR